MKIKQSPLEKNTWINTVHLSIISVFCLSRMVLFSSITGVFWWKTRGDAKLNTLNDSKQNATMYTDSPISTHPNTEKVCFVSHYVLIFVVKRSISANLDIAMMIHSILVGSYHQMMMALRISWWNRHVK